MTKEKLRSKDAPAIAPPLAAALEDNKDVKLRVEGAAIDLASARDVLKAKVAVGDTELAAQVALKVSKEVEDKAQECADDLDAVNATLAQGVAALEHTENALAAAQETLVDAQRELVVAQAGEREALLASRQDPATGLPNREHFNSRLMHDIAVAARHGFELAVMFFDLDKFKNVNDTHGHAAGDAVLKHVAARLLQHCRVEDTVCRTGGDEFLYLLMEPRGRDNIARIASSLLRALARPVVFNGLEIVVTPSIGISLYPEHGTSAPTLIGNADAAMYVAKKTTDGPGWVFFDGAPPPPTV